MKNSPSVKTSVSSTSSSKTNTISMYMKEIMEYPLLTQEQEKVLVDRISKEEDGALCEEARDRLIKSNLRLVVKLAQEFTGRGVHFSDLISEGNLGLMRAIDKFDPSHGAKFSSYAALWIKQYMRRAMCDQTGAIHIPVHAVAQISKFKRATVKLTEKLGRTPTDKELAKELSIQERTVSDIRQCCISTTSIHAPVVQGKDGSFEDIISDRRAVMPDEILNRKESFLHLSSVLQELPPCERKVICLRFGLDGRHPRTLDEISVLINRTRERVRQIQNHALEKLRTNFSDEYGMMAS